MSSGSLMQSNANGSQVAGSRHDQQSFEDAGFAPVKNRVALLRLEDLPPSHFSKISEEILGKLINQTVKNTSLAEKKVSFSSPEWTDHIVAKSAPVTVYAMLEADSVKDTKEFILQLREKFREFPGSSVLGGAEGRVVASLTSEALSYTASLPEVSKIR